MLGVNLPQFLPCFGGASFHCSVGGPGPPLLPRQRAGGGAPATEVGGSFAQWGGVEMVMGVPSGKPLHNYWKWPFIVDFPIKNGDFPWFSIVMWMLGEWDLMVFYGDLMVVNGIYWDIPSGKLSQKTMERSTILNGKITYFDWAILYFQ